MLQVALLFILVKCFMSLLNNRPLIDSTNIVLLEA